MPTAALLRLSSRAVAIQFLIDAYEGARVRPGKGLPHAQTVADVLEDTSLTIDDVRDAFGDQIARMVAALTEDDTIDRYAPRKRALRERIGAAGSPVVDIAIADKVATLRHAMVTGTKISNRKLSHYRAVLALGAGAGTPERLTAELEQLLDQVASR